MAARQKMVLDQGYTTANLGRDQDEGGVRSYNQYKEHAWWHRSLTAKDQLRQRVAWALSQIFVVGEGPNTFRDRRLDTSANPRWLSLPKYYDDVCINHAFGNYRDVIEEVTYSPVMGVYLTSVRNKKANARTGSFPDENYARELMQLFSIGLVELNTDGEPKVGPDGEFIETYDNETITALARVFTGMVYNNNSDRSDSFGAGTNLHYPMDMYEQEHDTSQKVAFKGRLVVPARTRSDANSRKDISDVLDFLAYEHDNTGPFICRLLIQRLVMSNPPRGYLRRVVKVWNQHKRNPKQFQEVIKAILLDRTALYPLRFRQHRSPNLSLEVIRRFPTERTRLREPVLRHTALLRAYSPYPDPSFVTNGAKQAYTTSGGPEGEAGNQYFFIDNDSDGLGDSIGQAPFESESVFNFYVPHYQAPGPIAEYVPSRYVITRKLVSPEFQIISPVTSIRTMNHLNKVTTDTDYDIGNQYGSAGVRETNLDINLDFSRYYEDGGLLGNRGREPTISQVEDFLEDIDMKLCAGTMSARTKKALLDSIRKELNRSNVDTPSEKEDMVQATIGVLMISPDCAVIP